MADSARRAAAHEPAASKTKGWRAAWLAGLWRPAQPRAKPRPSQAATIQKTLSPTHHCAANPAPPWSAASWLVLPAIQCMLRGPHGGRSPTPAASAAPPGSHSMLPRLAALRRCATVARHCAPPGAPQRAPARAFAAAAAETEMPDHDKFLFDLNGYSPPSRRHAPPPEQHTRAHPATPRQVRGGQGGLPESCSTP